MGFGFFADAEGLDRVGLPGAVVGQGQGQRVSALGQPAAGHRAALEHVIQQLADERQAVSLKGCQFALQVVVAQPARGQPKLLDRVPAVGLLDQGGQ